MSPVRALASSLALLLAASLLAIVVFVGGVRTRNPVILRVARAMQRDLLNPSALRDAGSAGSSWAIVRVPGRRTGKVYDTPVGVKRVGDDLYISLPYGEGTQWLRNVLAADGATVIHNGTEISARDPEVVPIAEMPMVKSDRAGVVIFGVTHALRLRAASPVTGPVASAVQPSGAESAP